MRRGYVLLSIGLLGAAFTAVTTLETPAALGATVGCRADYRIASAWPTGIQANLTVTNLGDPVDGWTLAFDFPDPNRIGPVWGGTVAQLTPRVVITNPSWNPRVPTGGTVTVGLIATRSGSGPLPSPTNITFNGVPCTGTTTSVGPSGSPTASPSASPSATTGTQPPTVALTSPTPNSLVNPPATIELVAAASDPDGTITKVEFYRGGELLGTDTTAPYTWTVPNVTTYGAVQFRARAYDDSGLWTNSAYVYVSVVPPVATYRGTVYLAPVEIGCLMLATPTADYLLSGGDRSTVLVPGNTVEVVGQLRPDLMTTCQTGTVLQVISARVL
jgi:hypothetical protein